MGIRIEELFLNRRMALKSDKNKPAPIGEARTKAYDACPHCGEALSPWEQVLLSVDRALMCTHCWYRIIMDVSQKGSEKESKSKGAQR